MNGGFMYILKCSNDAYYTGSTIDLDRRLKQHQNGEGANFTKKHLPVTLVYYEKFQRIDEAFYREKQVQGWSRAKKEALIKGENNALNKLAACKNETHYSNFKKNVLAKEIAASKEFGVSTKGIESGVSTPLNAQNHSSLSEVETSCSEPKISNDK